MNDNDNMKPPPDDTGWLETEQASTKKRRRWPWVLGIVLAFGLGVGAGSGDDTASADTAPAPAETVTPEPEVITETETVEVEVGGECRAYADWLIDNQGTKDEIVYDGLEQMADILDSDGFMVTEEYVEIVNGMTSDMDDLTQEIASGNTFDCPAE